MLARRGAGCAVDLVIRRGKDDGGAWSWSGGGAVAETRPLCAGAE